MSAYTPAVLGEDLAVAALAGYLGTKAMEPVSMKLYELESEADRAREDTARPGVPYRIAAEKLTTLAGLDLSDQQLDQVALGLHYGLAISWAPLYGLLRRTTRMRPIPAGLATGAAMSVLADELMTPAFGFSAPNLDYPLATHLRGAAAHLVFGLAVAAVTETAWSLRGRRP
ncbi:DUF1440 domain-containing protein [Pseudonocardia broussonetiae]|uniref:DUF1440 domain-containing protein n=1 Tax=Pseudonocardia broussonetiae TaxID=2736640 RepID=A0A6M6JX38_9PSEU|nr:DUF1440 domain-containing protein [Pseudonocardia broussonetiae]QJY51129.1 DUF1440 domain-containing protein [Pseudonocardia broussonetiae]